MQENANFKLLENVVKIKNRFSLCKNSFQIEPFPNNARSDIVFLVKTATTKSSSEIEYCVSNFLTQKINYPAPVFKSLKIIFVFTKCSQTFVAYFKLYETYMRAENNTLGWKEVINSEN